MISDSEVVAVGCCRVCLYGIGQLTKSHIAIAPTLKELSYPITSVLKLISRAVFVARHVVTCNAMWSCFFFVDFLMIIRVQAVDVCAKLRSHHQMSRASNDEDLVMVFSFELDPAEYVAVTSRRDVAQVVCISIMTAVDIEAVCLHVFSNGKKSPN